MMLPDWLLGPPSGVNERDFLREIARFLHRELRLSVIPVHHPQSPVPRHLRPSWNPDRHPGKRASIRWKMYQTKRPTELELDWWFDQFDQSLHNVAIVTGVASGVNALDVDSPSAREWARVHLPPTPMKTLTSERWPGFRGEHWYYRADPDRPLSNHCRVRADNARIALDVRGQGGYAIAPGSLHLDGSRYQATEPWTRETLSQLPALDPALVAPPRATPSRRLVGYVGDCANLAERARGWLAKRPGAVEGNGGDEWTFITAAYLLNDFALQEDVAWSLLLEWNQTCQPPWSERELRVKFESARKSPHRAQTYGRLRDAVPPRQSARRPVRVTVEVE